MSTQDPRYDQSTATSTPPPGAELNQPPSATPQFKPNFAQPDLYQVPAVFNRFSQGRKIVLGSGVAAIIFFILPWYTIKSSIIGFNESTGGLYELNYLSWLLLIIFTGAMALPLLGKSLDQFVSLPYRQGQIALMGAGGITFLTFLFGWLTKPSDEAFFGSSINISFGFGFYLTMLALFAMCYGAWTMYKANE